MSIREKREPIDETGLRELIRARTGEMWIRDGLDRQLSGVPLIRVPLGDQPGAVADRLQANPKLADLGTDEPLDPGTTLGDLFSGYGERMLVIGEPGSGKSTLLLQLGRELLARNSTAPDRGPEHCPVVLLLSEWRPRFPDFVGWLCHELGEKYSLEADVARSWLRSGTLQLLLDGLDEVNGRAWQTECLNTLNAFLTDNAYARTGVVITCRVKDYAQLRQRLILRRGVRVRPLPLEVALDIFANAGAGLVPLREALEQGAVPADQFTTPLMIILSLLAFDSAAAPRAVPEGAERDIRSYIYRLYESSMLTRVRPLIRAEPGSPGDPVRPFAAAQTHHYLVHLARLMNRRGQTVVFADELTPEWLPEKGEEELLPPGRPRGLFGWFCGKVGLDHASTGTVGAFLSSSLGLIFIAPLALYAWGLRYGLWAGAGAALLLGFAVFLLFGVTRMQPFGRSVAFALDNDRDVPRAATHWRWVLLRALRWAPIAGALSTGCALVIGLSRDWASAAVAAVTILGGGLIGSGLVPDYERLPDFPGEALTASGRTLRILLAFDVLFGAALSGVAAWAALPWRAAACAIPMSASLFMVTGPGRAWLRGRAMAYGSRRSGLLPARIRQFLDHATERVLLRRSAGGFAFVHDSLQQYFAAADPADTPGSGG